MNFGTELKDQVSSVNQFVQSGIQFLNEFKDFIKERAQIEKEYAQKIEMLVKKHSNKKDKKALAMTVGDVSTSPKENDNEADVEASTFLKAWSVILDETENIAKERAKFSETLSTRVMEKVRTVSAKKEEIRKKHMEFAQKLINERDKAYTERKKAKTRYDECCVEVQNSQQKLERASDDKIYEKLQHQLAQDKVEMNNNKNLYILTIRVSNELKKKYYHSDVPALINQLQELNESRIIAVRNIWDDYMEFEIALLRESKNHADVARQAINNIDSHADSQLFIRYNKRSWEEPTDFVFEPSSISEDTEELINDENSQVYLSNKLSKAKRNLEKLTSEIESKKKEIDGMQSLKEAYENNSKLGDADAVTDMLDLITISMISKMHHLRFPQLVIIVKLPSGASRKVLLVKPPVLDCGYNCHARCEMKVPPTCTKQKGNIVRGIAQTFSTPGSPWGTVSTMSNNTLVPLIQSINIGDTWKAEALYDYIADTEEELSVSAGDIITVFELDDGSGWVKAFYNGKEGLVPASYIEYHDFVQVLYDYESQSPEELTIKEGDVIQVTNRDVAEGWWEGILNGVTGQFPANYVAPLE
ncbi:12432_t:CDS:10 [Funneliformis caledonium]|uniref:Protein BZZ1 n=2 Tax=Funneliformis TaxID=1117308 RepID=A0A9N8WC76_9GLOM|nr:15753_t:CDS:10 [Funneliformis mosseae]CAG8479379.1 12432_t:CDS:10 [Funneliformis caledonium]